MRRVVNWLLGYVVLRVQGAFPERLLNLAGQGRLTFWALEWRDPFSFRLTLRRGDRRRLEEMARRLGCTLEAEREGGLPAFLLRFRQRWALLLGLGLCLLAVGLLSRVVFTVEVSGNEAVSSAEILSCLRRLGLRPGAYGPSLELKQLSQEALLELPGLSWMGINLYGTRAEVIVREEVEAPELTREWELQDIRARLPGVVTQVEALNGEARVKEGDGVLPGEVLISGTVVMQPPLYSDLPPRSFQTQARGEVWARTRRTLTAQIPLLAQRKRYTGREGWRVVLCCFGRRYALLSGETGAGWELRWEHKTLRLPTGGTLPLSLQLGLCREYELQEVQVQPQAAQDLLQERLLEQLEALLGEEGACLEQHFTLRREEEVLTVTLESECREQIGVPTPLEDPGL